MTTLDQLRRTFRRFLDRAELRAWLKPRDVSPDRWLRQLVRLRGSAEWGGHGLLAKNPTSGLFYLAERGLD